MKRALFAVAVSVVGLVGCATDVEDPVPPAPAPEAQREPPKQSLSGQLRDPQQQLLSGIAVNGGLRDLPPQATPVPSPVPTPFK
jgi:hypothetical protein